MNHEKREAMHILDLLKAGEEIPKAVVEWALRVCGDAINVKEFADV